jgi:hypothetical protein
MAKRSDSNAQALKPDSFAFECYVQHVIDCIKSTFTCDRCSYSRLQVMNMFDMWRTRIQIIRASPSCTYITVHGISICATVLLEQLTSHLTYIYLSESLHPELHVQPLRVAGSVVGQPTQMRLPQLRWLAPQSVREHGPV